ncbi:NUDIX hydrolase [Bacterioplanes sanyensis]|uniref:NUDIX hydrolase n=1 Tax=Bacterioplanes sanyensis TaxID=1249553 RepID=UPI0018EE5F72|nr:NUDIX domain-containing protein [Bacterioplanes sanyensis]
MTQQTEHGTQILLFRHPLAGIQLVKGTLEPDDASILTAAVRELAEEAGITAVEQLQYLGQWQSRHQDQLWHFVHCHCPSLPQQWVHHCLDDGGHDFEFFWQPLNTAIIGDSHPVFQRAVEYIRSVLL